MTAALAAADVSVSFGGVVACDAITLSVGANETVGLTGPNGSGKSTFLNAVVGLVDASGELRIAGDLVALGSPQAVRRHGVVRTFQAPQNWLELSVLENVVLGSADRELTGLLAAISLRPRMNRTERSRWVEGAAALERVGLGALADAPAAILTYGQQRMLELARAIVGRPRVLLLDEPAAGLNAAETEFLGGVLGGLRDDGVASLVIDHKIDFLDAICDRILVLQLGALIAEGRPIDVWRQPGVIDAYLGIDAEDSDVPEDPDEPGP